ncbi:TlpA disulfide reductase family protein [Ramlibacter tataouinensis]|uniref:TlpA disulfide reductase family protein n=1 Tax=Ramlibacter tataouinensis TaxID=94132 RepID=UPI0022F38A28|nr:TlpA disulfide reductase family protein [Ramlibacter tataouinensis]WBY03554.1 TlpA disulfide reductase family protein [Ramlibacter tataouinensis]
MRMLEAGAPAPEWDAGEWLNTRAPLTLASFRGKVVVLHAFQMLCPACVQLATPQMQKLQALFEGGEVAVVGLHTVFEHHEAMTPLALKAFAYENRLTFPIGIDRHDGDAIPVTMRAYGFQGTPSLVLIDRQGLMRFHGFGHQPDLRLGVLVGSLVAEGD